MQFFAIYSLGYLVFHRKRLEPRVLHRQQHSRCHSVSFVIYISGAKFEEHCFDISGDVLDSVFIINVELFFTSSLSSFA